MLHDGKALSRIVSWVTQLAPYLVAQLQVIIQLMSNAVGLYDQNCSHF